MWVSPIIHQWMWMDSSNAVECPNALTSQLLLWCQLKNPMSLVCWCRSFSKCICTMVILLINLSHDTSFYFLVKNECISQTKYNAIDEPCLTECQRTLASFLLRASEPTISRFKVTGVEHCHIKKTRWPAPDVLHLRYNIFQQDWC